MGRLARLFRGLIDSQVWLSRQFDRLLPRAYQVDGNRDFCDSLVPKYLAPNLTIYDVGGGKHPTIDADTKHRLHLTVIGVDIDAAELHQAPPGLYDESICADITRYEGRGDADLVLCQALLEHVRNVNDAFASLAGILKPGGQLLLFVPSRNAMFARLNLLLPEELKKKLLYTVFPAMRTVCGFPSYYDHCTPQDFAQLTARHGLALTERRLYFVSRYFSCFFPAHLLWRLWLTVFRLIAKDQAAETFCMVLRRDKPGQTIDVSGADSIDSAFFCE